MFTSRGLLRLPPLMCSVLALSLWISGQRTNQ
jgi:hypothetical protein